MSRVEREPRAGTFEGWIAALTILAKYQPKLEKEYLFASADHDIIWFTDKPAPIEKEYTQEQLDSNEPPPDDDDELAWPADTKADAESLLALGLHWCTENNCWAKFT